MSDRDSARAVFLAGWRELHRAAGSPSPTAVARAIGGAVPINTLSGWFHADDDAVVVPRDERGFETVLRYLYRRSGRVPAGRAVDGRTMSSWQKLRRDARKRARTPEPVEPEAVRSVAPTSRPVVTSALRRDVAALLGRDDVLERILRLADPESPSRIVTVDGMAGVGKTALATRAAHRLAPAFPDGRYFVELHAHTPGHGTVDPDDVLARLLIGVGMDPRTIPETLPGRRDLWRDRSSGKRILLVLDDARDVHQIEPLLPSGGGCFTLVTSRRRLVALDGATPLPLPMLEPEPAAKLFAAIAGREQHRAADDAAVRRIVALCGYLPLAIVLLAGRVAHHPAWSIAELAEEFAAFDNDRLDELDVGDRAVRIAFTMSYERLPARRQQLFRWLGLHPGSEVDVAAASALWDCAQGRARRELEALYADHLLEETVRGRYQSHDLLREYARTLCASDPAEAVDRALSRLLDHFESRSAAASRLLTRLHQPTTTPADPAPRAEPGPEFDDERAALAWMRLERANLLACLDLAASKHPRRVAILAASLASLVERDGPWGEAVRLHRLAAETARRLHDRSAEADALDSLGVVYRFTGRYPESADAHRAALAIYRELGHRHGEANALNHLGATRWFSDDQDFAEAADLHGRALAIYRETGHRCGEALALNSLAIVHRFGGRHAEASKLHEGALAIYSQLGDRRGMANVLEGIGIVARLTGDHAEASRSHEQALAYYRLLGDRYGEASALSNLGVAGRLTGDATSAVELHRQSRSLCREVGVRLGEAYAVLQLGADYAALGDHRAANRYLGQAAELYRDLDHPEGRAEAANYLGVVARSSGNYGAARDLHEQALRICRDLGHRHAEAEALAELGSVHVATAEYADAAACFDESLRIYAELGDVFGHATVSNKLGALCAATGEHEQASSHYAEALELGRRTGGRVEEARALEGLARSRFALGDREQAVNDLRAAVEIYRRAGVPEAASATTFLATITGGAE
ncbi:tetratricopeptide repeat protein [Nocardia sp. NPDC050793]|uniref:tetratricopeptide repeat protein n=1 Tax=Nocardia sp. NPDC050793 TaxID=3155159 RepID=UPI0033F4B20C